MCCAPRPLTPNLNFPWAWSLLLITVVLLERRGPGIQGICLVGRSVLGPFGALIMHQNALKCPWGALKMHQNASKSPM